MVWMGGPGMRLRLCPLLSSRAGYHFSKWLNNWSGVTAVAGAQPTQRCVPPQGVPPAGLGEGVGDCRDDVVTQKGVCSFWLPRGKFREKKTMFFFLNGHRDVSLVVSRALGLDEQHQEQCGSCWSSTLQVVERVACGDSTAAVGCLVLAMERSRHLLWAGRPWEWTPVPTPGQCGSWGLAWRRTRTTVNLWPHR